MIELTQFAGETFEPINLRVRTGEVAAVFAPSEEIGEDFVHTLLGFLPPRTGRASLLGLDVYTLPEELRYAPLGGIGVALANGGLISNLKVWENILLPAAYHACQPADAEEIVVTALRACDYTDPEIAQFMGASPDSLTLGEKRLAAFLRIRVLSPPLCIYDSLFDELDHGVRAPLARLVHAFHQESAGRATLYTSTQAISVQEMPTQCVVRLAARGDT